MMCSSRGKFSSNSVPILDDPSMEEVKEEMKRRKPLLIRNWDIGPCVKLWSPEYVAEKMGQTPVKIHVSIHKKLDFIDKNFAYKTLPFDELMRRISPGEKSDYFLGPEELYYLRALGPDRRGKEVADFARDFPQLAKDLEIPQVFEEADFFSSVLRVSSAGMQLWTHYDMMDNILIQIRGKKRVILWPPSELDNLYLVGDKSKVIDVDELDSEKYPRFGRAIRYECVLEEGDVIFIPALWFHNIMAVEVSFGVNVFWKNIPHEFYDKKDPYGNKDLTIATKVFSMVENGVKLLECLPNEYKRFYLKRMISELSDKLNHVT